MKYPFLITYQDLIDYLDTLIESTFGTTQQGLKKYTIDNHNKNYSITISYNYLGEVKVVSGIDISKYDITLGFVENKELYQIYRTINDGDEIYISSIIYPVHSGELVEYSEDNLKSTVYKHLLKVDNSIRDRAIDNILDN